MGISAKILADSVSPCGVRLATLLVTMPRMVLSEFNTHRVLSRSSASSRAVPVGKRIAAVREDPFVPVAFAANRRGMSSTTDLDVMAAQEARECWLYAAENACMAAAELETTGVHKQWANRLLEPFLWHEVICGATEWSNFFHRRISKHAQPEMRSVAEAMKLAMDGSAPKLVAVGQWHLPLVYDEDWEWVVEHRDGDAMPLVQLSAARCARVSYGTHMNQRDPSEDLRLHDDLLKNGHMSPFEMPAMVGKRYDLRSPHVIDPWTHLTSDTGNYRAPWLMYRKTIKNEHDLPGDE